MRILTGALLAAGLAAPMAAQAKTEQFTTQGYSISQSYEIAADPQTVFDAATGDVSGWWDHSFSRGFGMDPDEFYLEPKAGGHFIERFGDGAEVLHATVIYVKPGEALRFDGPLGFNGNAMNFVVSYKLSPTEAGTQFDVLVNISGQINEQGAQAAAGVWDHFIGDRLKIYVEAGCHERPDEPCSAFEESGVEEGEDEGDAEQ